MISVITTLGSSSTEGNDITSSELNILRTSSFVLLPDGFLSVMALIRRKKFWRLYQLSFSTDMNIVGKRFSKFLRS